MQNIICQPDKKEGLNNIKYRFYQKYNTRIELIFPEYIGNG